MSLPPIPLNPNCPYCGKALINYPNPQTNGYYECPTTISWDGIDETRTEYGFHVDLNGEIKLQYVYNEKLCISWSCKNSWANIITITIIDSFEMVCYGGPPIEKSKLFLEEEVALVFQHTPFSVNMSFKQMEKKCRIYLMLQ